MKTNIPSHFPIVFVTMNSSRIVTLSSTWVLTFILCFLTPLVKSQIDGCSVQGIDIQQCLARSNSSMYIQSSCCKSLNQIVQAGFYCLCSLLRTSTIGLGSPSLVLPLSNCYISVPPLSLCQDLAPVPVLLPPESPKEQTQLSSPPDLLVPSPPQEVQVPPTNLTMDNSTTSATGQQHGNEDDEPKLCVLLNGAHNTRVCLWQTLLLSLWVFLMGSNQFNSFSAVLGLRLFP